MNIKMFSYVVIVLCLVPYRIVLTVVAAESDGLKPSASEFKRYTLVKPIVQHGRTRRDLSTTKDINGAHHPEVLIKLPIDGEELVLDLQLNHDLLTENHVLTYQEKGETVVHKPKKEELDLCHYGGTIRDKPGSWAAVSTCRGVHGAVFDGKTMRYIEPAKGGDITSPHYLYDHSDLMVSNNNGSDVSFSNNPRHNPQFFQKLHDDRELLKHKLFRHKRQAFDPQVRAPYNADKRSRYVEMALVADYSLFMAHGGDIYAVYNYMKTIANIVNYVYAPLNIFVALVNVEIWNENDKIYINKIASETLNNFLKYRRTDLLRRIPNDNAHLITARRFEDDVLGIAYKGVICSWIKSGGVSSKHTDLMGLQAITTAHELGHNFGMNHDEEEEDCDCPGHKCIMSMSSTDVIPTQWSTCSLNALASSFEKGVDFCLRNKPRRLFIPSCGNGFVEAGEQCDCGTTLDPHEYKACYACCDPDTCRLRANATCAAGECCDFQTCSLKSAGTVCRSADRECDLPEYCTGESEFCPDDLHKMDTTPCGKGEQSAYCVRGNCHSHTAQCRMLWGSTGKMGNKKCYTNMNVKGNKNGHCGYDRILDRYQKCDRRDAMCGQLQCSRLGNEPNLGVRSTADAWVSYIRDGNKMLACHTASVDMGLEVADPGMVPDGAKCGHEMMCWQQRCMPVAHIRRTIMTVESSVCPSNCSGHGVCNSAGQCHCEPGYAPPLCTNSGPGGSYSSGHATGYNSARRHLEVSLYVVFLGIIPLILLILLLIYCLRPGLLQHAKNCLRKIVRRNDSANLDNSNVAINNDCLENDNDSPNLKNNLRHGSLDKDPNNLVHKIESKTKFNSVLYSNLETLTGQQTVVNSNDNLTKVPNSHYANFKISDIQKPNINKQNEYGNIFNLPDQNLPKRRIDAVHSSSDNIYKTPVTSVHPLRNNLPNAVDSANSTNNKFHNTPVKVSKTSDDSLYYKTPVNAVNISSSNLKNNLVNPVNLPSNNLHKTVFVPTTSSNDKLEKVSGNIVRKPGNLRKTPVNVVKSHSKNFDVERSNISNSSENIANVFNVKLRKTPVNTNLQK